MQEEVLQQFTKKIQEKSSSNYDDKFRSSKPWSSLVLYNETPPLTTLQPNSTQNSQKSMTRINYKASGSRSVSRKRVSERVSKGLCWFCGDKWDKNHIVKCKVYGKLNVIFLPKIR